MHVACFVALRLSFAAGTREALVGGCGGKCRLEACVPRSMPALLFQCFHYLVSRITCAGDGWNAGVWTACRYLAYGKPTKKSPRWNQIDFNIGPSGINDEEYREGP